MFDMVVTFERGASEAGECIGERNLDERGAAHEAAAPNGRKGGWQGELPQRGGAQEGVAAEAGEGGGQGELRERGAFGEGFVADRVERGGQGELDEIRTAAARVRRHRGHAFRRKKHEAAHRLAGPQGP